MTLERWRGENVLVTDALGLPVLGVDARGNVVEMLRAGAGPSVQVGTVESLARSVAGWIAWTADEPGEFRACDIHPAIRARVSELVPEHVEG
jgi:hypothetical protein